MNYCFSCSIYSLNQGFSNGGDFSYFGGESRGDFKICGDELILDILELQMKCKKKGLRRIFISNFESYTKYSEVADEKKGL